MSYISKQNNIMTHISNHPYPAWQDKDGESSSQSSNILYMLTGMIDYFAFMVDPSINRFYYRYLPESGQRFHNQHCPIRDLGSAWDAATLVTFFRTHATTANANSHYYDQTIQQLGKAIGQTIGAYTTEKLDISISGKNTIWYRQHHHHHHPQQQQQQQQSDNGSSDTCAIIPSAVLQEPSTIAHSAFLILATIQTLRSSCCMGDDENLTILDPPNIPPIDSLVRGILSMQLPPSNPNDGAFAITFGNPTNIYKGIEFYPGEALLALMETYDFFSSSSLEEKKQEEEPQQPPPPQRRMPHYDDDNEVILLSKVTHDAILPAVTRAFLFYTNYYRNGNVEQQYTSFFGNWQVQCFGKLFSTLLWLEQQPHHPNNRHAQHQPPTTCFSSSSHDNQTPPCRTTKSSSSRTTAPSRSRTTIASPSTTTTTTTTTTPTTTISNNNTKNNKVTAFMVAEYIFELCDAITMSRSWHDQLDKGHNYDLLATVEIACGLEALAEGVRVASQLLLHPAAATAVDNHHKTSSSCTAAHAYDPTKMKTYKDCIDTAIQFVGTIQQPPPPPQDTHPTTTTNTMLPPGYGGLGHAIHVSEQRLDVTGHAANALIKVYSLLPHHKT